MENLFWCLISFIMYHTTTTLLLSYDNVVVANVNPTKQKSMPRYCEANDIWMYIAYFFASMTHVIVCLYSSLLLRFLITVFQTILFYALRYISFFQKMSNRVAQIPNVGSIVFHTSNMLNWDRLKRKPILSSTVEVSFPFLLLIVMLILVGCDK